MATTREYQRNSARPAAPEISTGLGTSATQENEKPVQIDGFGQVVEMLMAADPAFRDKYVTAVGFESLSLGPAAFAELLKNDRDKYAARFRGMDLKLE